MHIMTLLVWPFVCLLRSSCVFTYLPLSPALDVMHAYYDVACVAVRVFAEEFVCFYVPAPEPSHVCIHVGTACPWKEVCEIKFPQA